MVAFFAYFAPYFLLPATFKFAGGAVRQIGGFVNDRSKGGFDRLRNFRNQRAARNIKAARAGQRWNEQYGRFKVPFTGGKRTSIGHLANRAAVNLLDQDELAPYRIGKTKYGSKIFGRGSARLGNEIDSAYLDQSTKAFQELQKRGFGREAFQGIGGDWYKDKNGNWKGVKGRLAQDYAGYAAGTSIAEVLGKEMGDKNPTSLADFDFVSGAMMASTDDKVVEGGKKIRDQRGYLANIKTHDPEMAYADLQAAGLLGMAATGYDGKLSSWGRITTNMSRKGRLGESAASLILDTAQSAGKQSRPDGRDRYGLIARRQPDGSVQFVSSYEEDKYGKAATGSVITLKGTDWSGAKGEAVDEVAETVKGMISGEAAQEWINKAEAAERAGDTAGAQEARNYAEELLSHRDNIKKVVAYGANNWYSDPGAQGSWAKIADDLIKSGTMTQEELLSGERMVQDEMGRRQVMGDGGGDAAPGGAPGGAGPGQ